MTLGIFWDGIPAAVYDDDGGFLPTRCVRAVGLEHDVTTVYFRSDQFARLRTIVDPDGERFGPLPGEGKSPALLGALGEDEPQALPAPTEFIPYHADLVFAELEQTAAGEVRRVVHVAKDLYFVGARKVDDGHRIFVDQPGAAATFPADLVEVAFVDIRAFFESHGEITRRWNVRLLDDEGRPTDRYERDSVNEDGSPKTLAQITQDCLDRLPGRLKLRANNKRPVFPRIEVEDEVHHVDVRAWAAGPREVLEGLLDTFGLVFCLNWDSSVSVYRPGEGEVQDYGQLVIEDLVTERAPTRLPSEVVVVGRPSAFTAGIDYALPVVPVNGQDPFTGQTRSGWRELTFAAMRELVFGDPEFSLVPSGVEGTAEAVAGAAQAALGNVIASAEGFLARAIGLGEGGAPLPLTTKAPGTPVSGEVFLRLPLSAPVWSQAFREETPLPQLLRAPGGTGERITDTSLVAADEFALRELQRNMLRYYQVPPKFRHLLPLDDRAERWPSGARMSVVAQVFTAVPKKVDVTEEVLSKILTEEQAQQHEARQLYTIRWQQLMTVLQRLQELEVLDLVTLGEFFAGYVTQHPKQSLKALSPAARLEDAPEFLERVAYSEYVQNSLREGDLVRQATGGEPVDLSRRPPGGDVEADVAGQARLRYVSTDDAVDEVARVNTSQGEIDGAQVVRSLEEYGRQLSAIFIPLDETTDVRKGEVEELNRRKDELEKELLRLERIFDPVSALERELAQLEKRRQAIAFQDRVGVVPGDLQEAINAKRQEIADEKAKQFPAEDLAGPYYRIVAANLPRRTVPCRVVDREAGVIELAEPAYWVASPTAENLAETFVIPMPVRILFGTRNRRPQDSGLIGVEQDDLQPGVVDVEEATPNELTRAAVEQLARDPNLLPLLGDSVGNVHPAFVGGEQVRFTFSRTDLERGNVSGQSEVSPTPYRIAADDEDFRLLVEVTGQHNLEELRVRALAMARAAMGFPRGASRAPGLPGAGRVEAGTRRVAGPRSHDPNGRVTAVEIALEAGEEGYEINTTLSFDPAALPLPGVAKRLRQLKPVRLRFGLDVEG